VSLRSVLDGLRQLRYPAPLRIGSAAWKNTSVEELKKVLQQMRSDPTQLEVPGNREADQVIRILADVGTGLWRLKQRMLKPGTTRPLDEMNRAYRHLESTWDVLVSAGVEVIDHTNTPFEIGMQVKVLAFEPRPGISRERIVETIKPSVYYRNELIQLGEVLVATPEKATP
jgi:hypothetical protein